MFNAISKPVTTVALSMLLLCSCGNSDKEGASQLFTQTEEAIQNRNYTGALTLLDTLNARYPKQLDIRKAALRLRASAMEGIAIDSIGAGDMALAQATIEVDRLRPQFRHVESSVGLEGYFLPNKVSEKVMTATGIQARVSDKGYFYIVANVQGRNIGLNSIEFYQGNECVASSAISSARIVKVEGSESASFNPEELEGVGEWLLAHDKADKVVLVGSKGKAPVKLDKKLRQEITDCYQFSRALQAQRSASIKREKYERMLATARDQLANLPTPEPQQ